MFNHYYKTFDKLIEPKIIDYDGKTFRVNNTEKNEFKENEDFGSKKSFNITKNNNSNLTNNVKISPIKSAFNHSNQDKYGNHTQATEEDINVNIKTNFSEDQMTKRNENMTSTTFYNVDNVESLRQMIKVEKQKNMNLRYENQESKKQIAQMDMTIKIQSEQISKLEKLREGDKRYVIKLENSLRELNELKSVNIREDSNKLNSTNTGILEEEKKESSNRYYYIEHPKEIFEFDNKSININDKIQVKEVISNLDKKNKTQKEIIDKIYDFSTKKEDINSYVFSLLKKLAVFFDNIRNPQDFDLYNVREVLDNFDYINKSVIEFYEKKHQEYLYLLNKKIDEYSIIEKENIELSHEVTKMKLDRGVDIKLIKKLELECFMYKEKIKEIELSINTPKKRQNFDFHYLMNILNDGKIKTDSYKNKSLHKSPSSNFSKNNAKSKSEAENSQLEQKDNKTNNNKTNSISNSKKLSLNNIDSRKLKQMQNNQNIIKNDINRMVSSLDPYDNSNVDFASKLNKVLK